MHATDILQGEHLVIEQVLTCLEKLAHQCVEDKTLDATAARQALDFFQMFADQCHHAKEEAHLFPLLEARGFPPFHGPIQVMPYEHDLGRQYLRAMRSVMDRAAAGDPDALALFADQARGYVILLREHIAKEDQRLFPMANHRLTEQDREGLLEAFAGVEDRHQEAGTHEKFLKIAGALAERFGVRPHSAESVVSRGCCSCGHHG
jgi:hemerythrin-like domain-containing protein